MAEASTSFWERAGFRKASGVSEAGWGQTLFAAAVSLIYFLPVLIIIITSFKLQTDALAVPPKLIPWVDFQPTLENFGSVFSRSFSSSCCPARPCPVSG